MKKYDISSPLFKLDPFPVFEEMRADGPVVWTKVPMIGKIRLATTHAAVSDVLKGKDKFALNPKNAGRNSMPGLGWWMPKSLTILTKNMLTSDEPDHRRLRGLVDKAFHRQNLDAFRDQLESLADKFLDQLPKSGTIDFVEKVAKPFPLAVICELLGIPEKDRSWLSGRVEKLTTASNAISMMLAFSGIKKLLRYFENLFEDVRKQPCDGLISALVHAEEDGEKLDTDELLAMVFMLFLAGHETTIHLLGGGLWTLETFQSEKKRLFSDPGLMEPAVDELLRHVSPVQITKPRYAIEDMEFHGVELKRGEPVMAFLASANSDPEVFEDPTNLDLSRKPNPHLAFGAGIHFCLGFQLARMEGQIIFSKMYERFPNLKLDVAVSDVEWKKRIGMRALKGLPVNLGETI